MALILTAVSGGVDSSVAAYLLKEAGHDILAVNFKMLDASWADSETISRHNAYHERAKKVCKHLGVPFLQIDVSKAFYEEVVNYFVMSYTKGFTPNPCTLCNPHIKFSNLLKLSVEHKADYFATGHYAQVFRSGDQILLAKGTDKGKDQSYFLYRLTREHLEKLILPLGEMFKEETQALASKAFPGFEFPSESQDVCFLTGSYKEFLKRISPESARPGNFVDKNGHILGKHKGIAFYTVGQRKGFGLALGKPMYVYKLDSETGNVIVAEKKDENEPRAIAVSRLSFVAGVPPACSFECYAKIRYRMREKKVRITIKSADSCIVQFLEPCPYPAPGQSIVFYEGEIVIGGGIIKKWL